MPLTPWFPMTHTDAQRVAAAIRQIGGNYDTTSAASIVAAIRSGNANKIPNGSVFVEHHDVYGDIYFVTRARNQHKVVGEPDRPTITIQPLYLLSSGGGSTVATFQYDRAEAFASVSTAILSGAVCKFTLASAFSSWAAGTYHFTATNGVAAGSKLCISGDYSSALTNRSVTVYASAKATSATSTYAIESGDGNATVDLGTLATATCNHPQRICYGSNNEAQSNLFQWLNADTGSAYMDSVFVGQTPFDMMDTSFTSKKGFLGGFSDEFRSYLGLCSIPNITNNVYETSPYTTNTSYTHNGYFFLPSRMEIYGTPENANENGETQFSYYAEIGKTDADKLMYAKGAVNPTTYWLRTPSAGYADGVRICNTGYGGALNSHYASNSSAVAPLAILA